MTTSLIYVMGASGCGKDSLLSYGRDRLAGLPGVQFAHRYITRSAHAGGENHVSLSAQEFDARNKAGLFAMHWKSHGHDYGIGIEINQWLAKGITVVVNGSREYLDAARQSYPEIFPVWVEVAPDILRERLQLRGRESESDIAARLMRHQSMSRTRRDGIIISNDGLLAEAGEALVAVLKEQIAQQTTQKPKQQSNQILCA